jgi:hypothetical protein
MFFWGMHWYWWFFCRLGGLPTGKCNRLCSSCNGDMPPGKSQPRNTKNGGPNFCGMPR